MAWRATIKILALVALTGCGGGDESASGPSPTPDGGDPNPNPDEIPAFCADFCALQAEANCPDDSHDICIQGCVLDTERFPGCGEQLEVADQCLVTASSDVFECNDSGNAVIRAGESLCNEERVAILDCYRTYVN